MVTTLFLLLLTQGCSDEKKYDATSNLLNKAEMEARIGNLETVYQMQVASERMAIRIAQAVMESFREVEESKRAGREPSKGYAAVQQTVSIIRQYIEMSRKNDEMFYEMMTDQSDGAKNLLLEGHHCGLAELLKEQVSSNERRVLDQFVEFP